MAAKDSFSPRGNALMALSMAILAVANFMILSGGPPTIRLFCVALLAVLSGLFAYRAWRAARTIRR